MKERLGVDIGGVIIDRVRNDGTDTSFLGENYLATSAVEGALKVLAALNRGRFAGEIFIVSKCGPKVQRKSLAWLAHQKWCALTGIPLSHVHFCLQRHEKAGICEELGITHFVDDRLEVLSYLTTVPNRFLFQGNAKEIAQFSEALNGTVQVSSWDELQQLLTAQGDYKCPS